MKAQKVKFEFDERSLVPLRGVMQELGAVADIVLAYRPKPKSKAAKRRKRKAAKRGA